MTDAAGYTRLSDVSDTSIADQKALIREYAAEREFTLVTILDEGERVSGFDRQREKYEELVRMARDGEVDAIIVRDRARLGRDQWLRMQHFSELVQEGIDFHTVEDGFIDPEKPMALLEEAFYAQQHDVGKREEIEKSKQATERRIDRGCYHGRLPNGLQFAPDKCHLEKSERWDDVMTVFDMLEEGVVYRKITEETGFNAPAISEMKSRGRAWYETKLAEYGV